LGLGEKKNLGGFFSGNHVEKAFSKARDRKTKRGTRRTTNEFSQTPRLKKID